MYALTTVEPQVRILEILHSCSYPHLLSLFDVKVLPGRVSVIKGSLDLDMGDDHAIRGVNRNDDLDLVKGQSLQLCLCFGQTYFRLKLSTCSGN